MLKKTIALIFVFTIFQSFKSSDNLNSEKRFFLVSKNFNQIKARILPSITLALANGDSTLCNKQDLLNETAINKFNEFNLKKWDNLKFDVFYHAYKGYNALLAEGIISNSRYLTIINYSISANKKRLWVLDMLKNKVAITDLVSHGRNSGEEYARQFSNAPESFKSSLGFFVTGMPYLGKNDYSLRLHGVEEGINDNAYDRGIVIHGANYVSTKYIRAHKRLGRSQGCPAVPVRLNPWLINTIQGGSCVFVYFPSENYFKKSQVLNSDF